MVNTYGKRELTFIGRTIVKTKPEVAETILSELYTFEPKHTELTRIPSLFISAGKPEKRVFIAFILQLYKPAIFKNKYYPIKRGLNKIIAETLKVSEPCVCQLIPLCVHDYNHYDDFKIQVDKLKEDAGT